MIAGHSTIMPWLLKYLPGTYARVSLAKASHDQFNFKQAQKGTLLDAQIFCRQHQWWPQKERDIWVKPDFCDFEAIKYYHLEYSLKTVDHLCYGLEIFLL